MGILSCSTKKDVNYSIDIANFENSSDVYKFGINDLK